MTPRGRDDRPRRSARRMLPHTRPKPDEAVEREIAHHLEERVERLLEEGLDCAAARREAERRFGDVDEIRAELKAVDRSAIPRRVLAALTEEFGRDLRFAARSARRSPWFALAVVATLAVAIGANVAIFSVVEAVLLRPLPFPDADRIVYVHETIGPPVNRSLSVSPGNYLDWRERQESFEVMAAMRRGSALVTGAGDPDRIPGAGVSSDYFRVFGVKPLLGRTFTASEDGPDPAPVVVVSHGFWTSRLGRDPDAVGRTLRLGGAPHTVIGVMPAEFGALRDPFGTISRVQVWWPGAFPNEARADRDQKYLTVVARLEEGVDPDRAEAEMDALALALAEEHPNTNEGFGAGIYSLAGAMREAATRPLAVLFGAVAFVLLIACLNVGNLLLARAEARRGSITLRRALGASRGRVVRQLLTESLLLSMAGSALGVILAATFLPALIAASPTYFVGMDGVGLNGTVLAFAVGVALLTTVTVGFVPALRASPWNLADELKLGSGSRAPMRGRAVLVVGEIGLAAVLVVGAGLMLRSYQRLVGVDLGIEVDDLVSVSVQLPRDRYADEVGVGVLPGAENDMLWRVRPELSDFVERVGDSMGRVPGVVSVAAGNRPLLSGPAGRTLPWPADLPPPEDSDGNDFVSFRPVTADWFETVGMPLVQGRSFHEEERRSEDVIVLDEQTAEAFWPGQSAIGRWVTLRDGSADTVRAFEVVGVAGNVRQQVASMGGASSGPPVRAVYIPYRQQAEVYVEPVIDTRLRAAFAVRISRDPRDLIPQLRQAVWSLEPELPVEVEPVADIAARQLGSPRFYSGMLGAFGAVGLLLAALGVFAVMTYSVSRKTRELGLRMALGARAVDLERAELSRGALLAVLGIAIGGLGAALLSRFLSGFLFGVGRLDPTVYAASAALLATAALVAAYVPARRASRVDPMESLRVD